MDISQRGIELIQSFEGKYKLRPDGKYQSYLDTLAKPAVWTVYCGLTKGVNKDTCITVEQGDAMFAKELAVYEDAIERLTDVPLNQNQFDALTSFVYNCGVGAYEKSTLRKLLNQGKYDQVPAQLMKWVNAGGKPYNGLIRRRAAEGALFLEPIAEEFGRPTVDDVDEVLLPAMPQRVEEAKPTVVATIKESPTVWASFVAMVGTIGSGLNQGYEWIFTVAKEAGPEVVAIKTTLTPFDALFKLTGPLLLLLTITSIAYVVIRKISKR